jgi:large subunit ribosomal protein L21
VDSKVYAVIETGGKQYKVAEGDVIYVEKLDPEEESSVNFKVLAIGDDKGLHLGEPYIEMAEVKGKILNNGKCKKITVFKYKPKKGEKRKLGHRQPYTKIEIDSIKVSV